MQRAVREALLRAGADRSEARSAHAAMWAHLSVWPADVGAPLPVRTADLPTRSDMPPPRALPVVRVNPLPLLLDCAPRSRGRGRCPTCYRLWQAPSASQEWSTCVCSGHEAGVPSQVCVAALATLLPGRVRIMPFFVWPRCRLPWTAPHLVGRTMPPSCRCRSIRPRRWSGGIGWRRSPLCKRRSATRWTGSSGARVGDLDHFPTYFSRIADADADTPNIPLTAPMPAPGKRHALTAFRDIALSLPGTE